jgi:DNA-binding transcriptional ArsR family regulator
VRQSTRNASIEPQPSGLGATGAALYSLAMTDTDMLSTVAALLGEPARTRILTALLTGRALTAKELAYFAGVTAATASSHLSRLLAGNLLVMEKQGRCHYYRLRSAEVARAIEGLMTVATIPSNGWPPYHRVEPALREARLCYDHMAGRLGVAVCDMLLRRRHVVLVDGGGEVTSSGERFLSGLGVELPRLRGARRQYCRGCIDWTERRHHMSGAVGAALAEAFFAQRLVTRVSDSRALVVTPLGRKTLAAMGVADHRVATPSISRTG